jgi:RNA-binding protein Luc7-like 2
MDRQRSHLDELMGRDRNKSLKERLGKFDHYTNGDVCKYFLVSVCPHDLFPNTKYDLGPCKKRHDEYLRRAFENEPDEKKAANERVYIQESISTEKPKK